MPQLSAAVLPSTPSSTSASASIRRAAPLFVSPLDALRSSEAVRSSRVIATAAPIDAAPLKSQHRVRVSLIWESLTSHSFGPLVLEVHTTHAAHAATARRHAAGCVLLRHFGHHGFGGDQESRDGSCVLDRHTHDLGRVDDALGDEVAVFAGLGVEAVSVLVLLQDLADDDGAVFTSVDRDLARRIGQRLAHDLDAGLLVVVLGAQTLE